MLSDFFLFDDTSLTCDLSEYNVLISQCEGILSTKILQSDQTTLYRSNYLKYLCFRGSSVI